MSDIILSVREPFISDILDGSKIIEIRTQPILRLDRGDKVFLAKPGTGGQIIGSAICTATQLVTPKYAWEHYKQFMQIYKPAYDQYTVDHDTIFLIWLTMPCRLRIPIPCNLFGLKRIPQSYCYV